MDFASRIAAKKNLQAAVNGNGHATATSPTVPAPSGSAVQSVAQANGAAPAAPAAAAPVAPAASVAAPAAASVSAPLPHGLTPPPWAFAGCTACGGLGFTTRGNPCRICDIKASEGGRPTSLQFTIEPLGDGRAAWASNASSTQDLSGISPMTAEAAKGQHPAVKADERVAPPAPAPAPAAPALAAPAPAAPAPAAPAAAPAAPAPATPAAPAPATPAAPAAPALPLAVPPAEIDEEDAAKGRGRPRKGFILLINCAPIRGHGRPNSGRGVRYLSEVLVRYGQALAEASQAESYYDLDAFARRDAMAKVAVRMAEEFGADLVVASTLSPDEKALVAALRPYAGMEIVGGEF